eukprot:6194439-Pleurochrysis_carterae.AAC.1
MVQRERDDDHDRASDGVGRSEERENNNTEMEGATRPTVLRFYGVDDAIFGDSVTFSVTVTFYGDSVTFSVTVAVSLLGLVHLGAVAADGVGKMDMSDRGASESASDAARERVASEATAQGTSRRRRARARCCADLGGGRRCGLPTLELSSGSRRVVVGLVAVLWLHGVLVVASVVPFPSGLWVNVPDEVSAVAVEWVRLARVVALKSVILSVEFIERDSGRPHVLPIAHETIVTCACREAFELGADRLIARGRTCAQTREDRIAHHGLVVRNESVAEVESSELLDATQGEHGVGVVVRDLGRDNVAFGATLCKLLIVHISRFAPRLLVTKLQIRPDILERYELLTFRDVRIVYAARVGERLALRLTVARLAIHGVITKEAAAPLVGWRETCRRDSAMGYCPTNALLPNTAPLCIRQFQVHARLARPAQPARVAERWRRRRRGWVRTQQRRSQ